MEFEYFYVEQSENYTFYRIPKLLFTEEIFNTLTTEAKVLYGLLMDRVGLSRERGWQDEEGHVYVYYSMGTVMIALHCGKNKACRLLRELENFGLIERRKQGFCKPARIFVKNFTQYPDRGIQSIQNSDHGVPETGIMDSPKHGTNNTEKNNTEIIKTDPILSGRPVDNCQTIGLDEDADERESYREYLYDHLEMELLYQKYPYDREILDSILTLMLDVICSKRKSIRIAGDDKPVNVVRSMFMKVNHMHIEYVMECLKENETKPRNIKQYLLSTIYNAPLTMKSYYQAWVNNDIAEGRL